MTRRPRMLVIGNSHIQMVRAAQEVAGDRGYDFESHWLKSRRHGEMTLAEAEARIATLGEGDLLVLARLGAQHNLLGLLEHERPYRVFDPVAAPEPGAASKPPIPVAVLRAEFAALCARDTVMDSLCAIRPCRIVHFGPPPPKRQLDRPFKFREVDGQMIRFAFNDPLTRLALWRIEAEAVAAHLSALGVENCPVPAEAVDAQGFLDARYGAGDATHANAGYGALLLDRFESILSPSVPRPARPRPATARPKED